MKRIAMVLMITAMVSLPLGAFPSDWLRVIGTQVPSRDPTGTRPGYTSVGYVSPTPGGGDLLASWYQPVQTASPLRVWLAFYFEDPLDHVMVYGATVTDDHTGLSCAGSAYYFKTIPVDESGAVDFQGVYWENPLRLPPGALVRALYVRGGSR